MSNDKYGEARLWDLAAKLIDDNDVATIDRAMIRAAGADLSDRDVEFVFEIVEGER